MADENVDGDRQNESTVSQDPIISLVRTFLRCDRSTQLLLLENGGWKRLNESLQSAISSKNVPVIKEILNVVLVMPTTISQLKGDVLGPITLTVEFLLNSTARGIEKFGNEAETNSLKLLCAEIFARWLKILKEGKKEEIQDERLLIEGETGEKCVVAPIASVPGYGVMALDGQLYVVEFNDSQPSASLSGLSSTNTKVSYLKEANSTKGTPENETVGQEEFRNAGIIDSHHETGLTGQDDIEALDNNLNRKKRTEESTNDESVKSLKPDNPEKLPVTNESGTGNLSSPSEPHKENDGNAK